MPLGVCVRCQRAYIFGVRNDARDPACPQCGTGLRPTSVRRMVEQPSIPLSLPAPPDPRLVAACEALRAA